MIKWYCVCLLSWTGVTSACRSTYFRFFLMSFANVFDLVSAASFFRLCNFSWETGSNKKQIDFISCLCCTTDVHVHVGGARNSMTIYFTSLSEKLRPLLWRLHFLPMVLTAGTKSTIMFWRVTTTKSIKIKLCTWWFRLTAYQWRMKYTQRIRKLLINISFACKPCDRRQEMVFKVPLPAPVKLWRPPSWPVWLGFSLKRWRVKYWVDSTVRLSTTFDFVKERRCQTFIAETVKLLTSVNIVSFSYCHFL